MADVFHPSGPAPRRSWVRAVPGLAKHARIADARTGYRNNELRGGHVPAPSNLAATPWCAGSPPQDSEDSQERPPERIGRLVRNDREYDADHDAYNRHEISDAKSHVVPRCRRPGD